MLDDDCYFIASFFRYLSKMSFHLHIVRHRLPKEQWWLNLRPLLRILAKHESAYVEEAVCMDKVD